MNHTDIDAASFKNHIEEDAFILLDVRTDIEFKEGYLRGAKNIDFHHESFEEIIDGLDKEKRYLVYCRSGNRSRQAMHLMRDLGFEEVHNLAGGIIAWNELGFNIEK